MTVSSTTDRATFPGNGVATVFPLPFRFFANSDIQAGLVDDVTLEVTPQILGVNYSLVGAGLPEVDGNAESELTMFVAPPIGKSLFVQRVMSATQPTDIVNQGRFLPDIHETVFDRLTMLIQQTALAPSRTIRVPETDPVPGVLPSAGSRANKVFGFDENGDPIVSTMDLSDIEQQPIIAQEAAAAAALSADSASGYADAASSSADSSDASALLAQRWAENPEDDPVLPGMFSAFHWANKAEAELTGLDARVGALEAIGKPFTKEYVSPPQAITAGGLITLSHGLGAVPKIVSYEYVCTVAAANYSIGDVIQLPAVDFGSSTTAQYGFSTTKTSAQLLIRCASSGGFLIADKTTGGVVNAAAVAANFQLIVRAFE